MEYQKHGAMLQPLHYDVYEGFCADVEAYTAVIVLKDAWNTASFSLSTVYQLLELNIHTLDICGFST